MPGLLAAGYITSTGSHQRRVGAKTSNNDATRPTSGQITGVYNVPHNVGHTNYTVQVTSTENGTMATIPSGSYGSNSFQVAIINHSGAFTNSNFQYAIFGDNNV